jgi:hypothetical protein
MGQSTIDLLDQRVWGFSLQLYRVVANARINHAVHYQIQRLTIAIGYNYIITITHIDVQLAVSNI